MRGYAVNHLIDRLSHRPHGISLLWRVPQIIALHRQRRKLASYDDRMLDDMGIDRLTAEREAARPIWDVPQTWLR